MYLSLKVSPASHNTQSRPGDRGLPSSSRPHVPMMHERQSREMASIHQPKAPDDQLTAKGSPSISQ